MYVYVIVCVNCLRFGNENESNMGSCWDKTFYHHNLTPTSGINNSRNIPAIVN